MSIDSVGRPTMSVVSDSAIDVGPCVAGLAMLNKFEFVTCSTNKSFDSSMNSKCGATPRSVLFTETYEANSKKTEKNDIFGKS